jgi:hypothetical protein
MSQTLNNTLLANKRELFWEWLDSTQFMNSVAFNNKCFAKAKQLDMTEDEMNKVIQAWATTEKVSIK